MTGTALLPHTDQGPIRPDELEDWLNKQLYHKLSWRLACKLVRTPVTPDMVSCAGALTVMLAALAYSLPAWPWSITMGLALHMGWHVLDGADGDLARLSGRCSSHGEIIDGMCDYAGHIVLYVTLGSIAAAEIGITGWALMAGAGASRVVQAAHYEGVRRQYQLAVHGTPWLASEARPKWGSAKRKNPFVSYYLWLTGLIVPHGQKVIATAREPKSCHSLREALRKDGPEVLAKMTLLSANYRTIAVAAAMLAGKPEWYFLFEIMILNLVLVASVRRSDTLFGTALAQVAPSSTLR